MKSDFLRHRTRFVLTLGTSNSANSSSPLKTLTNARSLSLSLISLFPSPLPSSFKFEPDSLLPTLKLFHQVPPFPLFADSLSRRAKTGASGDKRLMSSRGGE